MSRRAGAAAGGAARGEGLVIVTDGFSCREQIAQTTDRQPMHLAEVLDMAIHGAERTLPHDYPERAYVPSMRATSRSRRLPSLESPRSPRSSAARLRGGAARVAHDDRQKRVARSRTHRSCLRRITGRRSPGDCVRAADQCPHADRVTWPVVGASVAICGAGGDVRVITPEDEETLARAGWGGRDSSRSRRRRSAASST